MTREQRLDEEMECLVRWNDPFSGQTLWHITRVWEVLVSPRLNPARPGGNSVANLLAFRRDCDAALFNLRHSGYAHFI